MPTNVPLTIQSCLSGNLDSVIAIGSDYLSQSYGGPTNIYWYVVVDRTNLNVVQNFTTGDNGDVPAQLNPYLDNPQYMLVLTTMQLASSNLPVGNLYKFLTSIGAGTELNRLEQIYGSLNCGNWGWMAYTLVTVFDTTAGYDFSSYQDNIVSTLTLMPVNVGSSVLFTPVLFS